MLAAPAFLPGAPSFAAKRWSPRRFAVKRQSMVQTVEGLGASRQIGPPFGLLPTIATARDMRFAAKSISQRARMAERARRGGGSGGEKRRRAVQRYPVADRRAFALCRRKVYPRGRRAPGTFVSGDERQRPSLAIQQGDGTIAPRPGEA